MIDTFLRGTIYFCLSAVRKGAMGCPEEQLLPLGLDSPKGHKPLAPTIPDSVLLISSWILGCTCSFFHQEKGERKP